MSVSDVEPAGDGEEGRNRWRMGRKEETNHMFIPSQKLIEKFTALRPY